MRTFLWSNGDSIKGKAKVAWEEVCFPKSEGGLGIRRLVFFNKALMVSHIWKLFTRKDSLWVKWIHAYKLSAANFWAVKERGNMSTSWRRILQLRPLIRNHIWSKVGNGHNTSLWFDNWSEAGQLARVVSVRDIFRAGLNLNARVNDIAVNGILKWPENWVIKYPMLNNVEFPSLDINREDILEWRDLSNQVQPFSIQSVWQVIRPRKEAVDWESVVWFANCIPRHAFHLWLIIKRRLRTQDRMQYYTSASLLCPLCDTVPDSHDHLFFECNFSRQIWMKMKHFASLHVNLISLYDVVQYTIPIANRRTSKSVILKLVLAAVAYFVWQERNRRLFKGAKRSIQQVTDSIMMVIRLKLLSCRLKKSNEGMALCQRWQLSESIFIP